MTRKANSPLGQVSAILLLALLALLLPAGPGPVSGRSGGASQGPAPNSGPITSAAAATGGRWVRQSPLPTGNWLFGVTFVDASTGWAVGRGGTMLNTTNGGQTWTRQASGTTDELYSLALVDAQTGWAVGLGGTILRYYGTYPRSAFLPFLARSHSPGW